MYLDFKASDMILKQSDENDPDAVTRYHGDNGQSTKIVFFDSDSGNSAFDPYDNVYRYVTDDDVDGNPIRFIIISVGIDGKLDWPSGNDAETASSYDSSTDGNKDNISSDEL